MKIGSFTVTFLIATARFKKAMDRASEAEAFTRKIAELAADLSASAAVQHPLLEKRPEIKNGLQLVLCSNRGLCGGYNGSILRETLAGYHRLHSAGIKVQLEVSGKRGIAYIRYQGLPTQMTYTQFEDKPRFEEVEEIANRYLADYLAGKTAAANALLGQVMKATRGKAEPSLTRQLLQERLAVLAKR